MIITRNDSNHQHMQWSSEKNGSSTINILIVDDHRLFAEGLSRLLQTLEQPVALDQCYSAQQAIQKLDKAETKYDLLLIDLLMPGIDGIGLLHAIKERHIATPVAVLSSIEDTKIISQLIAGGALGFIPKSVSSDAMLSAVTTLLRGDVYLPDDMWDRMDIFDTPSNHLSEDNFHNQHLGERQMEVLQLMADGSTNKQIATILGVSEATVKYHIGILFRSLGVKNRTACIHAAQNSRLIS